MPAESLLENVVTIDYIPNMNRIDTSQLAVGQTLNFTTNTRFWRGFVVLSVDQQRGRLVVYDHLDQQATPRTWTVPIADISPRSIMVLAT